MTPSEQLTADFRITRRQCSNRTNMNTTARYCYDAVVVGKYKDSINLVCADCGLIIAEKQETPKTLRDKIQTIGWEGCGEKEMDEIMELIQMEKKAAVEEAVPVFLKHLAGCEYIEVTTDDYESEGRKLARAIYTELFSDKA